MSIKSNKLKKTLTNDPHMEALRIFGLSPIPLSTYEVFKQKKTKYAYEVIKDLYNNGYLTKSCKESVQYEIDFLEKQIGSKDIAHGYEVRSRTFSGFNEQQKIDRAILRISSLENDRENWRYSLNFKGLLLYLNGHKARKINYKIINDIINKLKKEKEFAFLQYFDVFDKNEKIDLLIEIATELQFLLKTLTQEYLRNYIVNRCYDEIVIALPIDVNAMFNKLFAQEISKTREYRLRILDELIAIQQDRLKQMEQEKKYLQSMVQ